MVECVARSEIHNDFRGSSAIVGLRVVVAAGGCGGMVGGDRVP